MSENICQYCGRQVRWAPRNEAKGIAFGRFVHADSNVAECAPSADLHAALVSAKAFGINSVPHVKAQDALYRYELGTVGQ